MWFCGEGSRNVCICDWRMEVNTGCLSNRFPLLLEKESATEPVVHRFSYTASPESLRELRLCFPRLGWHHFRFPRLGWHHFCFPRLGWHHFCFPRLGLHHFRFPRLGWHHLRFPISAWPERLGELWLCFLGAGMTDRHGLMSSAFTWVLGKELRFSFWPTSILLTEPPSHLLCGFKDNVPEMAQFCTHFIAYMAMVCKFLKEYGFIT